MLKNAWHPYFKKDINRFVEVLSRRIDRNPNIELRLNTEVTSELIKKLSPDTIIIAIGGKPIKPDIPGVEKQNVVNAVDLHRDGVKIGDRVVVIGGGLVGCEEGLALAKEGKNVTIIEDEGSAC